MKNLILRHWDEIMDVLESDYEVSRIIIDTWIRPLELYDVINKNIIFCVEESKGKHGVDYLSRKGYDLFLLSAIRQVLNDSDIELEIGEKSNYVKESSGNIHPVNDNYGDAYYSAVKKINLNDKYTFDNFIVGESNKHAYATCTAVADCPSQEGLNPLFLYGGSGLGKTHLIQSIAHYILQHDPEKNVLYVTSEEFTNEIIDAIQKHRTEEFRTKYRQVDVLIIDDIQEIIGRESTQQEFFNTFNDLYNAKKQIILSSDRPPKDIKALDERLRSRFEWGVPIDIHEPDYETRMAILHKKADIKKLTNIPEPVYQYIAENIVSNVRELEGALNKISIYSVLMNEEITVDLAKETLKDLISKDAAVAITPELILKVVSEHMNVSENDIKSEKRGADIALARQIVMYLSREYTNKSLQAIGDTVGGRNHATVISGVKKVSEKMSKDSDFKASIEVIIKKLNPTA